MSNSITNTCTSFTYHRHLREKIARDQERKKRDRVQERECKSKKKREKGEEERGALVSQWWPAAAPITGGHNQKRKQGRREKDRRVRERSREEGKRDQEERRLGLAGWQPTSSATMLAAARP